MSSQERSTINRIEELIQHWQDAQAQGRNLTPQELCRNSPDLVDHVTVLINQLASKRGSIIETTDEVTNVAISNVPHLIRISSENPTVTHPDHVVNKSVDLPAVPPGYQFLGEIGRGGMGVVYRALHEKLNRVEALKMIRSGEFAGPRELARFRFEAEAAAGLNHANIVPVFNVGETNGLPFLAMMWINGKGLSEIRIQSAREIAMLMVKIAKAVHYAHQRGFLHRDLKPDNILIDENNEPFVTDFGIARRIGAEANVTNPGGIVGTPPYMSPEQARGEANLTTASDVYSLGAILYFCLTGNPPFSGTNAFDILKQVVGSPPNPPHVSVPSCDPELEAVCLKCLEKDPLNRYSSAEALAQELERYLRGEGVSARPPGILDWFRQLWLTRPPANPNYSWQVPLWYGGIILAMQGSVYWIIRENISAIWFWAVQVVTLSAMWVIVWVYMARRFRRLPITERHSMMIAVGHLIGYVAVACAAVPLSPSASPRSALDMYPGLSVLSGLGLFILGSTHWSRFFIIGLAMMSLAPVIAHWSEFGPLIYGGAVTASMWFMAYEKKVTFGARAVNRE